MVKKAFSLLLVSVFTALGGATEPERSVIQIITFGQQPNWDSPWRFDSVRKGTGSGFVVKGKKIMTNAHVVSWARQIHVKRFQDPRPYVAKVTYIGHDCDLAVLEVEDESFFDGLEALGIGELPLVRSTVITYGYPAGGEQISYTRGVVSRVEMQNYVHIGNRSFLGVQTDAAINPGNSGGPVIQDGNVVGVAFQGIQGLENTGFFIPPPVINHFLKDIEDGTYDGFPQVGIRLVALQNPAQRKMLKLTDNGAGARIDGMVPIEDTQKLLKEDDVLIEVAGLLVGSDGSVVFKGNRLSAAVAFQQFQHGEKVPVKIWREGKAADISLPIKVFKGDRNVGNQYDTLPRYFVYGGLVFTPLSYDYMRTLGRAWNDGSNADLIYELYYRPHEAPEKTRSEPIVLATTLAHPVNANMMVQSRALVDKINGQRIDKLEDLIAAFETGTNSYHTIEFAPSHNLETLEKSAAEKANAEILATYNVLRDRRL